MNSRFDKMIFAPGYVTLESLGLFRIVYALFFLLILTPNDHRWAWGTFPDSFFVPPLGPMIIFGGFPNPAFFNLVAFVLIFALVLVLFGLYTKASTLTVVGALLILRGFEYSFGKINHDIHFVLLPLLMVFAGWGRTYSLDSVRAQRKPNAERRPYTDSSWAAALMALLMGVLFATAGLSKAGGDWLAPSSHAVQTIAIGYHVQGNDGLLTRFMIDSVTHGIFWEALDYATVIFEAGFLFAWLNRTSLRLFLCVAVIFHFGNMLLLDLPFTSTLIIYGLFVPWDRLYSRHLQPTIAHLKVKLTPHLTGLAVVLPTALLAAAFLFFFDSPLGFVFSRLPLTNGGIRLEPDPVSFVANTVAALFAIAAGFQIVAPRIVRKLSPRGRVRLSTQRRVP